MRKTMDKFYDEDKDREMFLKALKRQQREFKRNPKAAIAFYARIGLMTRTGKLTRWGKNVAWLLHAGQQKDPFTQSERA